VSSELQSLADLPNVDVLSYGGWRRQEIDRAILGFGGLGRIAKERHVDIIWSLNLGSYVKTAVPQILSVNNPHQVYPWQVTRYHPDSRLSVAALRWFFRKSLRVSGGVIVQTPIMSEYVRKVTGAPKHIFVLPKAVESTQDVIPAPMPSATQEILGDGFGEDGFTFLYVATYTPHKNHVTLVKAFDLLACKGVNARVVFTIGDSELLSLGGVRARRLIESGHLVPVGWIKKENLKSLYDACDACLMPSVLESLSSAHLEAMQWGKPQMTTDLPYARDLCGKAALYVSAEDPVDWMAKITEFISDAKLRASLVEAGHKRMKLFPGTWAEAARMAHVFLEEIIAGQCE
jgi:glycosyltransferase involved in cell wall biosynthesis